MFILPSMSLIKWKWSKVGVKFSHGLTLIFSTLRMVIVRVAIILGILLTLTTSVKGCPGQIMGKCFPIPSPSMGCGSRRRVRRSLFIVINFLRILLQFYQSEAPIDVNWHPYSGPVDSGPMDYGLNPGQNFMRAQGGCIHYCGWGKKKW